jgi:hypothetical protein
MKKSLFLYFIPIILLSCNAPANNQEETAGLLSKPHTMTTSDSLLRHVVLFKFKDSSSDEEVRKIVDAFRALPNQIDGITDFEWGTNVSPEGLADGFTHCFFVTFKDEKSRDEYLPHPAHEAFGGILGPHLDKVLVVDYWARK